MIQDNFFSRDNRKLTIPIRYRYWNFMVNWITSLVCTSGSYGSYLSHRRALYS
jgi:hypothetical protein